MAPFTEPKEINQAINNMLEENILDETREEQRRKNRAWIKYYKNELKRKQNESKKK